VKSEPAIKKKMKTRVLKKRCCKSQLPVDEVPSGTQGGIDSLCWGQLGAGALLVVVTVLLLLLCCCCAARNVIDPVVGDDRSSRLS